MSDNWAIVAFGKQSVVESAAFADFSFPI